MSQAGANLIGGAWREIPGDPLRSWNPARPSSCVWSGAPVVSHVNQAVASARGAFGAWSSLSFEKRSAVLRRFQAIAKAREDSLSALIRDEVGKPMWDARGEAQLIPAKVDITLDPAGPLKRVEGYEVGAGATRVGRCWFRPHGVLAVLGPFNFPAHLPNGHIIPALAMGNTVVFKPSDKAPAVGQLLARMLQESLDAEKAPPGVLNLVHGGADVASALTGHDEIDGVLFTGSWPVGRSIMQANLDRPGRILALEMGGNNAAAIMPDADLKQAVIECVRCAFISAGQRCTCTRRLIVHRDAAAAVIPAVCKCASSLILGDPAASHPVFMGPVITQAAREAILAAQERLRRSGGEVLVPCGSVDAGAGGWFVTPGVMRVEGFSRHESAGAGCDCEVFGPFLRVAVVESLDQAIAQTNATSFGLAASIFTRDPASADRFLREVRAGCVNVNTGTAGASSKLPFGGLGLSGNHRPAGAFSLDYCAYPVAGMTEHADAATISPGMRFEESWLR
ncbi:succinylglutamic semialdehyde dehydrogenase [Phycisphaerales bacterium]|nr:succinylglutamic semialdehyde dehydrogenase [Phycisphaerales bacterium]